MVVTVAVTNSISTGTTMSALTPTVTKSYLHPSHRRYGSFLHRPSRRLGTGRMFWAKWTQSRRCTDARPLLESLHWLPVHQRITFKPASVTFKTIRTSSPSYLNAHLISTVPSRSLPTTVTSTCMHYNFCQTCLLVCRTALWNSLPADTLTCTSVTVFKTKAPCGAGTPRSPLFHSLPLLLPFLLFPFLSGFNYFLLLSIPFLSIRILPLRFQAGGRRKQPNLGLVCSFYFVLSVFLN